MIHTNISCHSVARLPSSVPLDNALLVSSFWRAVFHCNNMNEMRGAAFYFGLFSHVLSLLLPSGCAIARQSKVKVYTHTHTKKACFSGLFHIRLFNTFANEYNFFCRWSVSLACNVLLVSLAHKYRMKIKAANKRIHKKKIINTGRKFNFFHIASCEFAKCLFSPFLLLLLWFVCIFMRPPTLSPPSSATTYVIWPLHNNSIPIPPMMTTFLFSSAFACYSGLAINKIY